jgi:tetratricopeptide (TPR) repeat protein
MSPADIASAFISTNMEKEGLALFGGNGNPKGSALNVMLFLHAFSGNEKFVELWLDSGVVRQENVLINLYYFALKNKRTRLALEIARRLFKSYDNEANMFRLAESLIAEKHFEEGIALINKDAENNNKAGQIYLSGISGLAEAGRFSKESPEAEKFLRICNKFVESPDAPESTVIAVAFALSNTGYHDRAKNLFYNLALAHPDMDESFTKMYLYSTVMAPDRKDFGLISQMVLNTRKEDEQKILELLETYGMQGHIMLLIEKRHGTDIPLNLYRKYLSSLLKCRQMQTFDLIVKKMPPPQSFSLEDMGGIFELLVLAGKEEEASVFYDALAQNKQTTSPSLARRLGFYFANNKKYEKSISVFFDLAKASNDPDSPDVSQLMSLPEIGTSQDVVNWLVEQAKSSKDEKQLKWLEYLNYIKQPEKVIEILREYYAE